MTCTSNAVVFRAARAARRRFVPDTLVSNRCAYAGWAPQFWYISQDAVPVSCLPQVQGGRGIVSGSTPAPLTHVMGRFSHFRGGHLTSRTHGPQPAKQQAPLTLRPNAQHNNRRVTHSCDPAGLLCGLYHTRENAATCTNDTFSHTHNPVTFSLGKKRSPAPLPNP